MAVNTPGSESISYPNKPSNRRKHSLALKMAATGAGLATALFGATKLIPEKNLGGIAEPATPISTADKKPNPNTYGNFYIGKIIDGEPTLSAVRPNGDTIEVPKVRFNGTTDEFVGSALALLAGYLTTGDQALLNELVPNSRKHGPLTEWYSNAKSTSNNYQAVFYDDPNDPAAFSKVEGNDGRTYYALEDGTLYYDRFSVAQGDNSWQSNETRKFTPTSKFKKLVIVTALGNNGEEVVNIDWHYVANDTQT